MFKTFESKLATLRLALSEVHESVERLDSLKINQGMILAALNQAKHSSKLKDYEFKVFSQWGEDGILQCLTSTIEIPEKTFIEFGVEDFFESNCRFLMMKDNWRGFVMDGSAANMSRLRQSYFFWKYELSAVDAFITRENVNQLLAKSGFGPDLGILSVDIDGNDYHVLEAIEVFSPRILICEYNAVFGPSRRITVPYDADFDRTSKHHSNLYYGASLGAIVSLANRKGYSLVGTNSAGNNAFFVRNDLMISQFPALDAEDGFTQSRFRDSRDAGGNLTYVSGEARLKLIQGLPVVNVETGAIDEL